MGNFDTALKVMDYVKAYPGKEIRAGAIAKACGASTTGVTGIMRRVIRSAREPVLEGRQGREITFRYLPIPANEAPKGVPGEVTLSFPTANGHAVSLTLEQARKVYDQLKVIFGASPQA